MDVKMLCRLCLSDNSVFSNIYQCHSSDDNPIYEVINYVYDLQISSDDGLPPYVCRDCLRIVKEFEIYKVKAHKIKRELLSLRDKNCIFIKFDGDGCLETKVADNQRILEPQIEIHESGEFVNHSEEGDAVEDEFSSSAKEPPMKRKRGLHDDSKKRAKRSRDKPQSKVDIVEFHGSEVKQNGGEIEIKEEVSEVEEPAEDPLADASPETNPTYDLSMETVEAGRAQEVAEEGGLRCNHCGVVRRTKSELGEHVYCAHLTLNLRNGCGRGKHKCGTCGREFRRKLELLRHETVHTGQKPFKCPSCEYSTSFLSALKVHLMKHGGVKPFQCHVCDYKTAVSSHLKRHVMRHAGIKPYKCKECPYGTANSSHFKRHLQTHSGVRPLKCQFCDYRTANRSHLARHLSVHTGQKPFKCGLCQYSSAREHDLKTHVLRHSGERPYKCDSCDYTASDGSTLRTHAIRHSGERPFKCQVCPYSTAVRSNLKKHLLTHRDEAEEGMIVSSSSEAGLQKCNAML